MTSLVAPIQEAVRPAEHTFGLLLSRFNWSGLILGKRFPLLPVAPKSRIRLGALVSGVTHRNPAVLGKMMATLDVLHQHCADGNRDPEKITVTHLITAVAAPDSEALRERIRVLRGRNQTAEQFAERNIAGIVEDLIELFPTYSAEGTDHSIVVLPDVALEGSIETFADVIAAFASS